MPLRDSFAVFDVDGSGKLSVDEFEKVLTAAGDSSLPAEDVAELIGLFDTNGDGEIDLEEFIAACDIFSAGEPRVDMEAEDLESKNAAFMATDAKMDELLARAGESVKEQGELDAQMTEIMNKQVATRAELWQAYAEIRAVLYGAKGMVKETVEKLVPDPPETDPVQDKAGWDAWGKQMEETEKPFKEAIGSIAAIKESEAYKAAVAKRDALNAKLDELKVESDAVMAKIDESIAALEAAL